MQSKTQRKHLIKMTELKTLKDIEEYIFCPHGDCTWKAKMVSFDKLKAEAVKWVKEFEEKGNDNREFDDEYPWCDYMPYGIIGFIKHFFNITEEDLK